MSTPPFTFCLGPISGENGLHGRARAQRHSEAARELLRFVLLSEYRGGSGAVILEKDEAGRPFLPARPDLHISLSHCGGLAACAAGPAPVGIDVERIRPISPAVVRRVLTDGEYADFTAGGGGDSLFLRYWTLKESYLKAIGRGLAFSMRRVAFRFSESGGIQCSRPGWRFAQFQCGGAHIVAVCRQAPL